MERMTVIKYILEDITELENHFCNCRQSTEQGREVTSPLLTNPYLNIMHKKIW